jgi:hypothetical protein
MKKLALILFLAALALPAVAQAKGALGAELCGADGCKTQRYATVHEDMNGPFGGLGGIVAPAKPGPWLRGSFLIGEPNGKVFGRIPFFYVPGADMMVQPGDGKEQPAWWRPQGMLARLIHSLAARVAPFPAPTRVNVEVDGKPVSDPSSYLGLYTIGEKTSDYPRSDAFAQVTFESKTPTPWTTHNDMVLYSDDHLLMRDGQIVSISGSTADRIARGATLEPGGRLPWVRLLAGLGVLALAIPFLLRLRARPSPRPVPQP